MFSKYLACYSEVTTSYFSLVRISLLVISDIQLNLIISPPSGKGNFGGIRSFAIDRGLDFCQLHVNIVRWYEKTVSTLSLQVIP